MQEWVCVATVWKIQISMKRRMKTLKVLHKKNISSINKGKAGEHLVCADTHLSGYASVIIDAQVYDIVMDVNGKMFKIQVKTSTFKPSRAGGEGNSTYFSITRGSKIKKQYNKHDDIDIFAFVNPNEGIWYIASIELKPKYKVILNEKDIYPLNQAISIILNDKHESI